MEFVQANCQALQYQYTKIEEQMADTNPGDLPPGLLGPYAFSAAISF
jgi:hypothetical protein